MEFWRLFEMAWPGLFFSSQLSSKSNNNKNRSTACQPNFQRIVKNTIDIDIDIDSLHHLQSTPFNFTFFINFILHHTVDIEREKWGFKLQIWCWAKERRWWENLCSRVSPSPITWSPFWAPLTTASPPSRPPCVPLRCSHSSLYSITYVWFDSHPKSLIGSTL